MAGEGNRSSPGNHEYGNSRHGHREGDSQRGRARDNTESEARSGSMSRANVTSSTRRDMGGSQPKSQQTEEVPDFASTEHDVGFMTTGQQVEAAPTAATELRERSPTDWIRESIIRDMISSTTVQQVEEVPGVTTASMERDWRSPTSSDWISESIIRDMISSTTGQQVEEVPGAAMSSVERATEEQVDMNEPQTKKTYAQVCRSEPPAQPARGCGSRRDL